MERPSRLLVVFLVNLAMLVTPPLRAQEEDPIEEIEEERLWTKRLGLSLLATSGNSETLSVGLNGLAKRRPTPWGILFGATALRVEDEAETTAERYSARVRGERTLTDRWSITAGVRGERDEPSGIDLRTVTQLGTLYQAIASESTELGLETALTYTTEEPVFEDPAAEERADDAVGLLLGLDYLWRIREGTELVEQLDLFPNLEETEDWRAVSLFAIQSALADQLAIQFGVEVRYDNLPALDADGDELESTDVATTLSLVLGDREAD